MTDCDFVVDVLKDGQWHSTSEILRYSIEERGVGLTVHSRISDLRARGLNVEYRRVSGERASAHQYRLVALQEVAAPSGGGAEAAASWSVGPPLDVPPHDAGLPQSAPAGAGLTDTDCSWPGPLQLQLDAA